MQAADTDAWVTPAATRSGPAGLPVGVQRIGRPAADEQLLADAAAIEAGLAGS
jgi:Asp-tRNA(Asn)/Glu-tRNA(Gln) amidotransferase A subunit family amidase